jgi:hydroxymethylbilane synthase
MITRESPLALWQTYAVTMKVEATGQACKIIPVKSTGDLDLINPIYEIGIQGVFTKELDSALLNDQADAAVHSLKDIPTVLADGLMIAAILERGSHEDILFAKPGFIPYDSKPAIIATSSIRRKAQWLDRFQSHSLVNVRGNIETRLKKFNESDWDGIIMARAGVERLGLDLSGTTALSWMLPSPAQGAIAVVCRKEAKALAQVFAALHHDATAQCVTIERDFLRSLQGGCSVPISALAQWENEQIHFRGAIHSVDGAKNFRVNKKYSKEQWREAGTLAAAEVKISPVGKELLDEIQNA